MPNDWPTLYTPETALFWQCRAARWVLWLLAAPLLAAAALLLMLIPATLVSTWFTGEDPNQFVPFFLIVLALAAVPGGLGALLVVTWLDWHEADQQSEHESPHAP